jgi:hypothetical protein
MSYRYKQTPAVDGVMSCITLTENVDLFAESFKSEQTKIVYALALERFKRDTGVQDLRSLEPKVLQDLLIKYVISVRQAGKSYSRQNNYISAVKAFCSSYDIEGINWEKDLEIHKRGGNTS